MIRLVFRPYTQLRRSICTSESLRTSTRVSSGFILARHSSPSFGSQHICSWYLPTAREPAPVRLRRLPTARFRGRTAPRRLGKSRACAPPSHEGKLNFDHRPDDLHHTQRPETGESISPRLSRRGRGRRQPVRDRPKTHRRACYSCPGRPSLSFRLWV